VTFYEGINIDKEVTSGKSENGRGFLLDSLVATHNFIDDGELRRT
jgi:hypothetical protein